MSGLSDRTIDIKCPNCGKTTKRSIAWVKNNTSFTCACGRETRLDSPEFQAKLSQVEAGFREREQARKNVER
jgi:lysyl-tRNA synthetase class I